MASKAELLVSIIKANPGKPMYKCINDAQEAFDWIYKNQPPAQGGIQPIADLVIGKATEQPPKPSIRRLTKEDVPELQHQLNAVYSRFIGNLSDGLGRAMFARHRAELFLCIECLKLGGEVFSKPDSKLKCTVSYNNDINRWESYYEDVILNRDFFFLDQNVAQTFLRLDGVQDALHEFYMIEKP